jgi:hypothetical protein
MHRAQPAIVTTPSTVKSASFRPRVGESRCDIRTITAENQQKPENVKRAAAAIRSTA